MKKNWDKHAKTFSEMMLCNIDDTRSYLDAAGITGAESVLDVCCGPGVISMLCAERGCNVVAMDSSEGMIGTAVRNSEQHGVADRCDFRLLDWECVLPGQNLEAADVVIASLCPAMNDVEKLSQLAKEKVVVQAFANAPSFPALLGVLFDGCPTKEDIAANQRKPGNEENAAHGTSDLPVQTDWSTGVEGKKRHCGPKKRKHLFPTEDMTMARAGCKYLDLYLKAYLAGYDPNVRILPKRFKKTFASRDEALDWICMLEPERAAGHDDRIALNAAPFLSESDDGIEFCIGTKVGIIWWDTRGSAAWTM